LIFISDIVSVRSLKPDELEATPPKYFFEQAELALAELDKRLRTCGVDKGSLLSVDVKVKDAETAWEPFTRAWNMWMEGHAPPVRVVKTEPSSRLQLCPMVTLTIANQVSHCFDLHGTSWYFPLHADGEDMRKLFG